MAENIRVRSFIREALAEFIKRECELCNDSHGMETYSVLTKSHD